MKNSLQPILKRSFKQSVVVFLSCLSCVTLIDSAAAQVRFSAPPVSAPGNREAGASRSDSCALTDGDRGLTAVLPETNVGITTKAFPSFFVYVPSNNAERIEFRLFDEETGDEVYAGQLSLAENADNVDSDGAYRHESSVVSISSNDSAVTLDAGKSYLWALMLVCNADNRAEDIVVTGVVQRTNDEYLESLDPAIREQLSSIDTDSMNDNEKLTVYGEAGVWHDLLETLALLTVSDPATYQSDWNALLGDQGLGAIANSPIIFNEVEPLF